MSKKFDPDNADMLAVAMSLKGNIVQIAKYFGVSSETIYQYMYRSEQGRLIIETVRDYKAHSYMDLAEHVVFYNMANYKTNPGLAQRSAEKVIDKLGHLRGWKEDEAVSSIPKNQPELDKDHQIMLLKAELQNYHEIYANESQTK
jgi:hypothetical protein